MTCVLFDVTVYGTTWQFSTQLSRPVFYLLLSQFMASLGSFPRSCPVLSFVFSFHSLWHHLAVFHAVVPSCLLLSQFTAIPLVELTYLVFTRMPGENYRKRLGSLLLSLCEVFRELFNSLAC